MSWNPKPYESQTIAGDFFGLLSAHQIQPLGAQFQNLNNGSNGSGERVVDRAALQGQATTVFGFQYADGIIMAGDRRATAGNIIVTDEVEKILELDRESLLAIAGSPAVAFEMARVLRTSFEYYRRSQLQSLSLSARTRAVARLLVDNIPMAIQGIGLVAPLFAGLDRSGALPGSKPIPKLFFYDPLGAQFQAVTHAASGSGSGHVRSILEFHDRFGSPRLKELDLNDAVPLALKLLQIASTYDSATGGVNPEAGRFATIFTMTVDGVSSIGEAQQLASWNADIDTRKSSSSSPSSSSLSGGPHD